jgi:membrane-associated protease RseP (regulator of RpoE activity)
LHRLGAVVGPATTLQEQSGRDEHSIVGDALFVNSGRGDYRVKVGSPALELGFKNFSMDEFGVASSELKQHARTPLIPETVTHMAGTDQQVDHWLEAEVKAVTTPGEVSATGLGRAEGILLVRVPPNSKAAKAGLRSNDVILSINGTALDEREDLEAVWRAVTGHLHLTIWREQKTLPLELRAPK